MGMIMLGKKCFFATDGAQIDTDKAKRICLSSVFICVHLWLNPLSFAATPTTPPANRTQQFCLPETDESSPRKSQLKSGKPDEKEIVRIDVDHDGDPDLL